MPPEAMQGMDADMMAMMPPEAMQGMDADMMANMPPEAMQGMDADMMSMMPPDAMQGMDADMMAAAPPGVMDAANPGMDDGGMGAMDAAFGDAPGDVDGDGMPPPPPGGMEGDPMSGLDAAARWRNGSDHGSRRWCRRSRYGNSA